MAKRNWTAEDLSKRVFTVTILLILLYVAAVVLFIL